MSSPVFDILKQLITYDKSLVQPVYIQVAQQFINAIQRGYIEKGTKLPGTRALASLLKVHRNTAVAIYDELASQGWVDIIANKGTFVLVPEQTSAAIKATAQKVNQAYNYPEAAGFPFQTSFHLASTQEDTSAKYKISDGQPDFRLHPVYQFSRWYTATMKRKSLQHKFQRTDTSETSTFKIQLSNFLNATRGFRISSQNILSTRSTEMSLFIVSQLLIKKGDIVLVGELSHYSSNTIFQEAGATIKTIPIDDEGLDVDYIRTHFLKNKIRCVYVSAHRHYPTTSTLSAERRLKLLQLAREFGFAIIEDDFDYDFQFEGSAMLPMSTADSDGMVIYLGKMGQSLFPSFQTGFVIAPRNLISEANNYLKLLDQQGDVIQEQILSELISEGEIYRLLKKNIITYKERLDWLCDCLDESFNGIINYQRPSGGLAIWLEFIEPISLVKFAEEAKKLDVFLPKTILYQDKNTCAIRFGFGQLNKEEISEVVKKLKSTYLRQADKLLKYT
ncbi:MAG: PLP-dependent aminotransferase family protein [Winogradskyella sp.]|uniref:aminotransferase-like domain-containing protein n=1 Tax=Winogradskyella sp. TaxID=1883156 RepID=UPI0025DD9FD0|nr:PLP-dependent aminotransferase family protein [Winogradskyella sp.]NRB60690.1 PLP-dependent aminotransferase family protein [Winogradskyella sp.]